MNTSPGYWPSKAWIRAILCSRNCGRVWSGVGSGRQVIESRFNGGHRRAGIRRLCQKTYHTRQHRCQNDPQHQSDFWGNSLGRHLDLLTNNLAGNPPGSYHGERGGAGGKSEVELDWRRTRRSAIRRPYVSYDIIMLWLSEPLLIFRSRCTTNCAIEQSAREPRFGL